MTSKKKKPSIHEMNFAAVLQKAINHLKGNKKPKKPDKPSK